MSTTTTTTLIRTIGPAGDWRHRAVCRGVDAELFHPAADAGAVFDAQVAQAKAVCAGCPVRAECLAFALDALPFGIAGGMTPAERRRHRSSVQRRLRVGSGRPVGGSKREVAAAGRAAIRAGRPVGEVAREFGVTVRTAERWATQVRTETDHGASSGGVAGTGAGRGRGAA